MSRRDKFHKAVKHGLQKDGWTITDDPLTIRIPGIQMYIDLGAEKIIGAEKAGQKIAIEVKSFMSTSAISEFHTALGQYLNYQQALAEHDPERPLYLAIPQDIYNNFFKLTFIQETIQRYQLKLIVYKPKMEVLTLWKH